MDSQEIVCPVTRKYRARKEIYTGAALTFDALVKMIRNAAGNPTEELRAAVGDDTQFAKMPALAV